MTRALGRGRLGGRGGASAARKRQKVLQGGALPPDALRALQREREFQAQVEQFAALHGWISWHDVDSRRNTAGLPDLLLLRERAIWVELKSQSGRLSNDQIAFIDRLQVAGQKVYVWKPSDWEEIERVLS